MLVDPVPLHEELLIGRVDRRLGHREVDGRRRRVAVRDDCPAVGRGRVQILTVSLKAAAPVGSGWITSTASGLEKLLEAPAGVFVLAGGDRDAAGASMPTSAIRSGGTGSSSQRGRYSAIRSSELDGVGEVHALPAVDHDLDRPARPPRAPSAPARRSSMPSRPSSGRGGRTTSAPGSPAPDYAWARSRTRPRFERVAEHRGIGRRSPSRVGPPSRR